MTSPNTNPPSSPNGMPWEHLGNLIPSEKVRKLIFSVYLLLVIIFQGTEAFLLNSSLTIPTYFSGVQAVLVYLAIPVVAVAFANVRNPSAPEVIEVEAGEVTVNTVNTPVTPKVTETPSAGLVAAYLNAGAGYSPKHAAEPSVASEGTVTAPQLPTFTTFNNSKG